jgi:PAS domain S-box-containing protein
MLASTGRAAWLYGGALACTALAVLARLLLDPALGNLCPYTTLFPAVLAAAWRGGLGPALAAAALGGLAADYLLIPPRGSLGFADAAQAAGMALYLSAGAGVALLGAGMRSARLRAERAAGALAAGRLDDARSRALAEHAGDGIFLYASTGEVLDANRRAWEMLGRTRGELIGAHFREIDPNATPELLAGVAADLAAGKEVTLESTYRRRDGSHFPVEVRISPFEAEGRAVLLAVARDATWRKAAEAALRESEARFRTLVEALPDAVFLSAGGRVAFCNPACVRLFGAAGPGQLLGRTPFELHPPRWHEVIRGRIAAIRATGEPVPEIEEEVTRLDDGRAVPVRVTALPVADGGPEAVLVVLHDLTSQKQLESQLRQSQKMEAFGQLAGGIAHDFNNLLLVINGYGDLVKRELPDGGTAKAWLLEMVGAGQRAATLVRQLLTFSRRQVVAPKRIDLNHVLEHARAMLARLIREDIDLSASPAPGLWAVEADPGQIEQVIINLVVNARDAMPGGGTITIQTRNVAAEAPHEPRAGRVLLEVSDTGCGMTDEVKARIFEPYFTTKEVGKGTGIGLATVYGIVEQAGGAIEVQSEVGAGSTFRIYLPRAAGDAAPEPPPAPPPEKARADAVVLLAEDEQVVRAMVSIFLRELGCQVLEAPDGAEAIRLAEEHPGPIDLLVSDVIMPTMGGGDLAARLLVLRPGMKVLFMSGYTDDTVVSQGVSHDHFAFLQKPFSKADLLRKVREVLDAPA